MKNVDESITQNNTADRNVTAKKTDQNMLHIKDEITGVKGKHLFFSFFFLDCFT